MGGWACAIPASVCSVCYEQDTRLIMELSFDYEMIYCYALLTLTLTKTHNYLLYIMWIVSSLLAYYTRTHYTDKYSKSLHNYTTTK